MLRLALMFSCLTALPHASLAQEEPEPTVHWAYASFFGTGWYKVSDSRDVFVIRAAPRWSVGEAGFDEQGKRNIEYTFRVPVTVGMYRFDFEDLPGLLDPDNIGTASVAFSLDADIPVTRRLSIRPSVETGFGTVLNESDSAWIYKTEVKSRYRFDASKLDWALLADIGFVGYEPNQGESDDFTFAAIGAEFAYPVDWFRGSPGQTVAYWHLTYTDFLDEIEFSSGRQEVDSVANYWQLGAALGKQDRPIKLWFMKFDRLGLAYNYSNSGQLRGIKFVFRSPYEL